MIPTKSCPRNCGGTMLAEHDGEWYYQCILCNHTEPLPEGYKLPVIKPFPAEWIARVPEMKY